MKSILVLMPHYNNLPGLERSLSSIDAKEPVDVLIVDDGSNPEHKPDIDRLTAQHSAIHSILFLDNNENRGIAHVLNNGLRFAREQDYRYIARLDCGDICHPDRFMIQRKFLATHKDYSLLGSWASFVDMHQSEVWQFRPATDYLQVAKKIPVTNQFCHPAVMFRTEVIDKTGYYPVNREAAEDYALFFNVVDSNCKTANIPLCLLKCEINPNEISIKRNKQQIRSTLAVKREHFQHKPEYYYGYLKHLLKYILPYRLVVAGKRFLGKALTES